jgi:hypothetical protein
MVSADHFAQGLRAQMRRAAKHGSIDIVINSSSLSDLITQCRDIG